MEFFTGSASFGGLSSLINPMNVSPFSIAAAALLCLGFPACISIGNQAPDWFAGPHHNIGAQLLDLKKARDQGLISPEEFKRRQSRILSRPEENGATSSP